MERVEESARRQQDDRNETRETDCKQKSDCPYAWQSMSGPEVDVHAGGFPSPAPKESKQEGMRRMARTNAPHAIAEPATRCASDVLYVQPTAARARSRR